MWRPHHSLFFAPGSHSNHSGNHSSNSHGTTSTPALVSPSSSSFVPLDLVECTDLFLDIELNSKQIDESKKLLEGILAKLSKHVAATQTASDTGKDLAEAFVEAGEKTKSWTDAGALSESFLTTGNLLRSLELLRWNILRSMQTQLRDVLDDFLKSEIAAAKAQRKQYDKARSSLVACEEKLRRERAAKAGEPKIFELEKDRNAQRDAFIEVQQQTITTLTDTNGKLAVTGVTALCNLLDASYEVYDRGHSALDKLKPAIRDYRQSTVGRTRRDVARRESVRRMSGRGESRSDARELPSPAAQPLSPRAATQVPEGAAPPPRPRPPRPPGGPGGVGPGNGNAQQAPPRPAFPPRSVSSNMVGYQHPVGPPMGPMGRGQPTNPPPRAPLKRVPSPTSLLPEEEVDYAATKTIPPGEVKKEGSLMKKGQKRKNWVSRWFVLKQKYLFYYTSHVDKKLKGVIKLSNCCVEPSNRRLHAFTINCRLRTYFICASNPQEQEEWMSAITSCIDGIEKNASLLEHSEGQESIPPGAGFARRPVPAPPKGMAGNRKVGPPEDKVKRAIQKFFASEKGYVKNLMSLKSYKFNMAKDPMFARQPTQVNQIFLNVEDICALHSALLADLEGLIAEWPKKSPGPVLLHKATMFEMYLTYVSGYSAAVNALSAIKKSRAAMNFLKAQEQMDMSGLDLDTLLSLPLQRPAQFELLLAELLQKADRNSPDYHNLEMAYQKLTNISSQVDKGTALSQLLSKNIQIRKKVTGLENAGINLMDSSRTFVREGVLTLTIESPNAPVSKAELMCFMFNDLLITAKENTFTRLPSGLPSLPSLSSLPSLPSLPTGLPSLPSLSSLNIDQKYRYVEHYFLHRYRVTDLLDSEQVRNTFQLTDGKTTISFTADSTRTKSEWLTDLQREIGVISKSKKVFGVALADLMTNHGREKGRDIPTIVEKAINFIITYALTTEGIFRLSARVSEVQEFRDQLDQGKDIDFPAGTDHHAVCGLLKLWFREMPEPLIPYAQYPAFIKTRELNGLSARVTHLQQQVQQLPKWNQFLLQHMVSFFQLVVDMEELNKMNKRNLAIVFGPNMLSPGDSPMLAGATGLDAVYEVFIMFIDHYDTLFSAIEEERRVKKERWMRAQEQEQQKERLEKQAVEALLKETTPVTGPGASSAATNVDKIVRQGWLSKKGAQRKNWNTRWFVLRYKSLGYYKTPQDITSMPKGKILLTGCRVRPSDAKAFSFQIECKDRTYLIIAKNAQEQAEWMADIESCIEP